MEQNKLSDKAILTTILKYFQTNIAQFSKKIGVDRQRLYDLNVGKTQSFTREVLAAIVKSCPEISPFFIVTGEGSMTDDATPVHDGLSCHVSDVFSLFHFYCKNA